MRVERTVMLVHVPSEEPVDHRRWNARVSMLRNLGWHSGTVGLCPIPKGGGDSPVPAEGTDPSLQALRDLGCEQAYGVRELTFPPGSLFADMDTKATPRTTLREWSTSVSTLPGGLSALKLQVETVIAHARKRARLVPEGEALFIASPHAWLLLTIANQLIAQEHGADRERTLNLEARAFSGIAIVDANRYWRGIIELSGNRSVDWYLERLR